MASSSRPDRWAETKSEFVDGVVLAMSGASISRKIIVANLISNLLPPLQAQGCQIYPSDLKVRSGTRFYYPDLSAICGDPVFHDNEKDVVLNPTLMVEVSTEGYDRGAAFMTYHRIPSLREYVLVHQHQPVIEQYLRQSDGVWTYRATEGLSSGLEVLGCPLGLGDVYTGVRFELHT